MSDTPPFDPVPLLANELEMPAARVAAVVKLLADGNTVPFIARYRKEVTGGLDEVQIRTIEERHAYLVELEERRQAILTSIAEQDKLTDELKAKILACTTKAALEDLYLPYKPKRRTRATVAREKGLEPLAERILAQPADGDPAAEAARFIDEEKGVKSAEEALQGGRDIVAEIVAENADVRAYIRQTFADEGMVVSQAVEEKKEERTKFEQYYEFREPARDIPSHRFLAIRRGEGEGVLRAHIEIDAEAITARVEDMMQLASSSPFADELRQAIADSYKRLLAPSVENDVRADLKMRSDRGAVDVFADNLRNLLLAAPLGTKAVIGIDPGQRTGCKCAAVDNTGKFLGHVTIHLAKGEAAKEQARTDLSAFIAAHEPVGIAVGNGTGGRETEAFVRKLLADTGQKNLFVIMVNEAGASVYSASDEAREEFADLDLTIRGAISIARRLQDPLAELVKIEPKAIGVGQYQHDVHQPLMQKKLGEVVESCVNHVGVELNTASAPLLSYVAGIGKSLAKKIVAHREDTGRFRTRQQLMEVSGLGPRAFEQAAGFLRIRSGENVLDNSAVHPERYDLVLRIAAELGVSIEELIGKPELIDTIDIQKYIGDGVGEPTLRDIMAELKKPGRDPRDTFEAPSFRDDVNTLEDLKADMVLNGVVTNVTAFGAFVDVGVHQDGLVHVSELADHFVKDPKDVVKVGDKIKVRVLDVDLERKRIALSARSGSGSKGAGRKDERAGRGERGKREGNRRGDGNRGDGNRGDGNRGDGNRGEGNDRGRSGGRHGGNRQRGDRQQGERQRGERQRGERQRGDGQGGGERQRGDRRGGPGGRQKGKKGERRKDERKPNKFTNNPFAKLADLDKG
ncbi:MAG: helix-hairpin-helix domain-containing protein [Proteobacteria bacterium]|nr:helix-hairpin-helix domain-containing protein [Pseudomonadota bacterium]